MQAIHTKYFGPTNSRGPRIKAIAEAGEVTVPYDHSLDVPKNHAVAADALKRKLGWGGRLVSGCLSGGTYAHVLVVGV